MTLDRAGHPKILDKHGSNQDDNKTRKEIGAIIKLKEINLNGHFGSLFSKCCGESRSRWRLGSTRQDGGAVCSNRESSGKALYSRYV